MYDDAVTVHGTAIGEDCSARREVMVVSGKVDEFAAALLAHTTRTHDVCVERMSSAPLPSA